MEARSAVRSTGAYHGCVAPPCSGPKKILPFWEGQLLFLRQKRAKTGRYAAVTGRYAAWRPTHDEIHDVCRYAALPHCGRAKLFSETQHHFHSQLQGSTYLHVDFLCGPPLQQ